jgi:hypothetical protein
VRPSREHRAVAVAIRFYSARWRSRHGEEATLLASTLLEDGIPWWSIALSFLGGATRERVVRKPSLRVSTTVAAIAVGVAVAPLALLASLAPAGASNANVVVVISKPDTAAQQLETAFATRGFKISVSEKAAPTWLVGSILSLSTTGSPSANNHVISEIRGPCHGSATGCIDGLVLPLHFSGTARVTLGQATTIEHARR